MGRAQSRECQPIEPWFVRMNHGPASQRRLAPMARTAPPDELSRREQRRLQHQDLSRAQLLDAAEEVFGRKGFHETTLKEVAELAEFSVGSVYSFFESKDDLFRQIFVRRGEEFMPGLRRLLDGETEADPVMQLHLLVDFEVGFFRARPHFGRFVNVRRFVVVSYEARRSHVLGIFVVEHRGAVASRVAR